VRSRAKFCWQVLSRGVGGLNSAAGWVGLVVLLLGVAAGITVPLVLHTSAWVTAVIVMGALVFVVLDGSYQVWAATDAARADAVADADAKEASQVNTPTFWNIHGGTVTGEINNTFNASQGKQAAGNLVTINPGSGIKESLVTVEVGGPTPSVLPAPLPSTPDERARLREQLLAIADTVETVMASWGRARHQIAAQMGIGPDADEFLTRMNEILAERSRIDHEAVVRYNGECRSAVVQAYGHARSIGFGDAEMERLWRTRLGAGASPIPTRLRIIAGRMSS